MLAGSLVMGVRGGRWPKGPTIIAGFFTMAAATIGFAQAGTLNLALAAFAVWGLCNPIINVPVITLMQQEVPPDQHGGAFSVLLSAAAAQPLSMASGGALGDWVGVRAVYTAAGLAFLLLALWMTSIQTLREAR